MDTPKLTRKHGDQIVYEQRVTEAIARIARGEKPQDIVQFMQESWGIRHDQARRYLSTARFRIQRLVDAKRQNLLGETLARHDLLRKIGFDDKDYRLVLDTDKEDAKLLGLYAPERHEVNLSGTDLDAAIERELARLAGASEEGAAGEDDRT